MRSRTADFSNGGVPVQMVEMEAGEPTTPSPPTAHAKRGAGKVKERMRKLIVAYVSCLCPPDTSREAQQEAADMRTATLAANAGLHGNNSIAPAVAVPRSRDSWLMRLLKREHYTDGSLIALKTDVFSGVTLAVAQVAPSLAFALMGHGEPLVGLFSSFFLGSIACVFGGRPGQITAIAGAVVVLYPDLVDEHGYGAVCAVSIIAGCFIALFGVFRVANLVRLLPSSLMLGFCNGLGISMVVHQIPQFKDEHGDYVTGTRALNTAVICVVSYATMMLLPYFTSLIPSAFVAIFVGTAMEYLFHMGTVTIGDLYELRGSFPAPRIPDIAWTDTKCIADVMVASVLTAVISAIESFMAGYKIQQLTETPTMFEREALALGAAHVVNGFFNGMAGCVVYGPCILNIECGSGTRRLSSLICAVLMVVTPLALYAVIGIIPMGALSAVLFGVSSKTADWRMLSMIVLQRISFQESVVAVLVTVITVVQDLAIGAAAGFAAALVFFMWNMSRGRVSMLPVQNSAPYSTAFIEGGRGDEVWGGGSGRRWSQQGPPRQARRPTTPHEAVSAPETYGGTEEEMMRGAEVHVDPRGGEGANGDEGVVSAWTRLPPQSSAAQDGSAFRSASFAAAPDGCLQQGVDGNESRCSSDGPTKRAVNLDDVGVATCAPAEMEEDSRRGGGGLTRTKTAAHTTAFPVPPSSPSSSSSTDEGIVLHRSMARNPTSLDVDLLDIKRDPDFPEIKVLCVKMRGVLFFGSCMGFIDGMIKLLHEHHEHIFLKVTDLVLDFQHGLMPVMDFSAAEAIEDVARIFFKRGIHTHVRNLDPLSWTCVERCRRYFPTVCEDDVNNVKHICYARRVFRIRSKTVQVRAERTAKRAAEGQAPGTTTTTTVSLGGGRLDEDVLVRANRSFFATTTTTTVAPAARAHRSSLFSECEGGHAVSSTACDASDHVSSPPTHETAQTADSTVRVELSATEEQVAFMDSVKVGFWVYRPHFGITTLVFQTMADWVQRTQEALERGVRPPLELGLTEKKPLNRQFCEFGRVWWHRLLNKDVPRPVQPGRPTADLLSANRRPSHPLLLRLPPAEYRQVPRFPGQGYSSRERFHLKEWSMIKQCVCRSLFHTGPPKGTSPLAARMKQFEKDLIDGFV